MWDGLTAVGAVVDGDSESVIEIEFFGESTCGKEEVP